MLKVIFSRRMLVTLVLGFSCGLPLMATLGTLQAWMHDAKVDLTTVGLFSLVGLPYTVKFLWSPFMDRFVPPVLGRAERRRSWILITQILLMVALVLLSFSKPAHSPFYVAFAALLVSFFSASQDIVVDAYRRELLSDEELGFGNSLYIAGYRIGMLVSGAIALHIAEHIPWNYVYLILAAAVSVGILATVFGPKAKGKIVPPKSMKEAVVGPFLEFFKRKGALLMLAFILFFKIGDTVAAALQTYFILDIGFTKGELANVVKIFGLGATMGGTFLGGILMLRIGINRSLWIFGGLQAISTLGFTVLAAAGRSIPLLAGVIGFENLANGMGTAAYVAYIQSISNKKYTATQLALLTSLMGIPRVLASAPSGFLAKNLGWESYFIMCTLMAVPGLILLHYIAPWRKKGKTLKI